MTYIKNNKTLVFIIAILLLSNIGLLYFFTQARSECSKGNDKKKENLGMREQMIKKLKEEVGFDTTQIAKYDEMRVKHKEAMKPLFEDITNAKDSFYKLLMQEPQPSDSMMNYYLGRIGQRQQIIDQRIFNHFYTLRQLCTQEQKPKYDSTIQRVIKDMITFPKKDKEKDKKKDK